MTKKIVVLTTPNSFNEETTICNALFDSGLEQLNLRKPTGQREEYIEFIEKIEPQFRNRIVIHDYYDLADIYNLKGIHLNSKKKCTFKQADKYSYVSVSCHSIDEIKNIDNNITECFLSPIFDSITKEGYHKAFDHSYLQKTIPELNHPIIALGGIDASNIYQTFEIGFAGAALLGGIWGKRHTPQYQNTIQNWQNISTPTIISIAGFDPSSGAGITADIKTAEKMGVYSFGVNTAVTIQNQYQYLDTQWIDKELIKRQFDIIATQNSSNHIKIGLIQSFDVLNEICDHIITKIPNAKICWDPILNSSTGYRFHDTVKPNIEDILKKIYLVTPNYYEALKLFDNNISSHNLSKISQQYDVNILIKGGHHNQASHNSIDTLYSSNSIESYTVLRSDEAKHGTGCKLSTAIVSLLAKGYTLNEAVKEGQNSVAQEINASKGLLFLTPKAKQSKPHITKAHRLMFLTHHSETLSITRQVELACRAGIKIVQLRMKDTDEPEFLQQAQIALQICRRHNALLIINDNVNICRQAGADGVHLGKDDMPLTQAREILGKDKIIGATCNTFDDIVSAHDNRVNYVGLGPFRYTETKKKLAPTLGIDKLSVISRQMADNKINLPTYAIGGLDIKDTEAVLSCGISGIAMSSSILRSADINSYINEIIKQIEQCKP